MMSGFKDKVDGTVDKLKGEVKDQIGKLTNDKGKQVEGKIDKVKGSVKEEIGKVKDKLDK